MLNTERSFFINSKSRKGDVVTMLFTMENGIFNVSFTAITTVAVALLMLLMGQQIKNRVALLQRYCIPSPVIGGVGWD